MSIRDSSFRFTVSRLTEKLKDMPKTGCVPKREKRLMLPLKRQGRKRDSISYRFICVWADVCFVICTTVLHVILRVGPDMF